MLNKLGMSVLLAAALFVLGAVPSHAQATRTWVSGVGDDANPCSRTAPCKTFAGAISKTATNGEISVLDPGGFGTVTITKSISIVSEGSEGSILACGTNGININAGATGVVNLHGLFIEGCATGINGINILAADSVHVQKCKIRGFRSGNAVGIFVAPTSTNTKVVVTDCSISENGSGIVATPGGTGQANVMINRVVVDHNTNFGIRPNSAAAKMQISESVFTGNGTGLIVGGAGTIVSFGNNVIVNNTSNGAPTSTSPLQ